MVSDLIQPSHQSTTIARTALKKKNKNRTFEWWWAQTGGKDPNSLGATWLPLPRIPLTMFGPLFFSFFFFSFFFIVYSLSPYSLARSKLSGRAGPLSLSSKARNGPVCLSCAGPSGGPQNDPFRPSRASTAPILRPQASWAIFPDKQAWEVIGVC